MRINMQKNTNQMKKSLFVEILAFLLLGQIAACSWSFLGDFEPEKGHIFGNPTFEEVDIAGSCDSETLTVVDPCGFSTDYVTPTSLDFSLEGYLGSSPSVEWGQQGPVVVVCGCSSIFPARGTTTIE